MNVPGALLTLVFAFIAFSAPRRYAILGVIGATCYVTQAQVIDVGGFHFTSIRFVLLGGIFRCFVRGEFREIEFNSIDKCFVAYVLATFFVSLIQAGGAASALVYQIGAIYNSILPYFLFRGLLKNLQEIQTFIGDMSLTLIPISISMMREASTGQNIFSSLGGTATMFRDGHYRCEAAFRSPITAGTLGATLMILFVGLYLSRQKRFFAIVGMLAATVIVICSRSSGPFLAYGSGLLALLFWWWREHLRLLRWSVLIALISLHLYMKAPVWYLMGHMSDIVGGGGWYRAEIVNQAVTHFSSWWMLGTTDTADWSPTHLADGASDLTNQFVVAGVCGGLLGLILFILIFVRSFRYLGMAMKKVRGNTIEVELMLWAIGCTLNATMINFFSVSYFDQIAVVWYLILAILSCASFGTLRRYSEQGQQLQETLEQTNSLVQPSRL